MPPPKYLVECSYAELYYRYRIQYINLAFPRSYSLLLRSKPGYHLLCTRLHGHYPAGQCYNPYVFGTECLTTRFGASTKAMIATITTVIINTILDPIFIYLFHWGIQGAAIATILAQIIALVWQFKTFTNKNELLHLHRGIYKLRGTIVKNTIAIGMSPFLMNLAACFIVIFINKGLKEYDGDLAIGAFGIVNRIVFLFVMIVMGLNQGMQPIAGYNFGAQQYHRVNQVLKLTIMVPPPLQQPVF